MKLIYNDVIVGKLKMLEDYLSVPIVFLDKSGFFQIKSGGRKQDVYKRFYNARYFVRALIADLEDEDGQ